MEKSKKKLVVITSREPYNNEGNSHMHYLDVLLDKFNVVFINPPEVWPVQNSKPKRISDSLIIFNYCNVFPVRFSEIFFSGLNDLITCFFLNRFIKKEYGKKDFLLWQFDPYYLNKISFLNIFKKVYFPLDAYFRDKRDKIFAERADLLVTVNSTFIDSYYHKQSENIKLIPHGYSKSHDNPNPEEVEKLKQEFGDFLLFTGSLSFGVDHKLMEKIADCIFPMNFILVGKILVDESLLAPLFNKKNVQYLGSKHYKVLKNYAAASSFCIVVYDLATSTWRNPIKITDYLAQGKPIVNTVLLKDLNPLEGKVLFSSNEEKQFLELIKKASLKQLKVDIEFVEQWKVNNSYEKLRDSILADLDFEP